MVDLTEPLEGMIYERKNHIAYITLNRPDRGNALHGSQVEPIRAIWAEVRDDPWIRCAIVTAVGDRHFCTGADVGAVASRGGVAAGRGPLSEEVHWSPRHNRVWKPVICAVNGTVASAGLHFVVDADIVVASRSAATTACVLSNAPMMPSARIMRLRPSITSLLHITLCYLHC